MHIFELMHDFKLISSKLVYILLVFLLLGNLTVGYIVVKLSFMYLVVIPRFNRLSVNRLPLRQIL